MGALGLDIAVWGSSQEDQEQTDCKSGEKRGRVQGVIALLQFLSRVRRDLTVFIAF